ncbi:hypothetical protein [Xylanimonas sp. McL0601]|uniref:hypothetical protein n=1 Tax=Xylanimonas sp. McL0601 TaxID=3414739 RepID=UPI003CEBE4BB
MAALDVDARLDALYAGPLEEFVVARDALAKEVAASGDRVGSARVKRLRRPTVAAWAVNQVAREHADEVAALAALGDELRAATADRDRGRIKALDHLRRERTDALVAPLRAAGELGGRPVSVDVLDRLGQTLTAAVMDPDAAAVVRAGRLEQALQHVGFGIVDEGGEEADVATLRTDANAAPTPAAAAVERADEPESKPEPEAKPEPLPEAKLEHPAPADAGLAGAERDVEAAAAEVDRLEALRDDVDARARAARKAAERHESELERLEAEVARVTAERDDARRASEDARRAEKDARAELADVDTQLDEAERQAAAARRARREEASRG